MRIFSVVARQEVIPQGVYIYRIIYSKLVETDSKEQMQENYDNINRIYQNPGGSVSSFYFAANPDQSFLDTETK